MIARNLPGYRKPYPVPFVSDEARRIAGLSHWGLQVQALFDGLTVHPIADLKGSARKGRAYYSYCQSWGHVVDRLRLAGYPVETIPGPRGGTGMRALSWRLRRGAA